MITVLYATMTGNARDCAEQTVAALTKAGLTAESHDLAKYNPHRLATETTVLLTISTWGDGEPPDDAVDFHDYVKGLEVAALAKVQFAVFALGDTSYEEFCKCGRDFDRMFEERGGRRLLDRVDNDVDYLDALQKWSASVISLLQTEAAVS